MNEIPQANIRRRRPGRLLAWLFVLLLTLPLVVILFISTTQTALRWSVDVAQAVLGEQLQIERLEGRLIGPLQVEGFRFRHAHGEVSLGSLAFDWRPRQLFFNHVHIDLLQLQDLRVLNTAPATQAEPAAPRSELVLDIQLPGDLTLANASLHNFQYQDAGGQQTIDQVVLSAHTQDNQVYINTLDIQAARSSAGASGRLALTPRASSELTLTWRIDEPGQQALRSSGTLNITGPTTAYRFDGEFDLHSTQIPDGRWQLNGAGNLDGLQLETLRGATLDGVITAQGKLDWQPELRWDITLDAEQLDPGSQWPEWPGRLSGQLASTGRYADGKPDLQARVSKLGGQLQEHAITLDAELAYREDAVRLLLDWGLNQNRDSTLASRGQLSIDGTPQAYRFNGEASLQSPTIPAGSWRVAGNGTQSGASLDQLDGTTLGGTVTGSGQIDWQPELRWDLSLDTRQLDPGQHWPDWPGRLSAGIRSTGTMAEGSADLTAQLTGLDGELRGYPVGGTADIALQGSNLDIRALQLQSGPNHLRVSGAVHEQIGLEWQLDAADFSGLLPDWSGSAQLAGSLFGSRAEPGVAAQVDIRKLSGPGFELQAVNGDLRLQQSERATQSIELQADGVLWQGRRIEQSTLTVSGTLPQHRIRLAIKSDEESATLEANGGWQAPLWRGTLATAEWNTQMSGAWTLDQPVTLTLGRQRIALPNACWNQDTAQLCVNIDGDPAQDWRASTSLQQLPLAFFNRMLDRPVQWDSNVSANLQVVGNGTQLGEARLQGGISRGTLILNGPDGPVEEIISGLDLDAGLDATGVNATLHLGLAGEDYADAKLRLPGYHPQTGTWQQQELDFTLQGKLRELALLRVLLEDVGTFTGHIDLDLQGRGTLARPRLAGDISLRNGKLGINRLGIELQDLQLALNSAEDALQLNGSASSGKGRLALDGQLTFTDIADWRGQLKLQGEDFEIVHLPEAVARVSPDLQVDIAPPELRLNGKLHVPSAHLKPKQLAGGVNVSKDVVIVETQQEQPAAERWKIYTRLLLSLGDDVRLDGFGVKGHLTGSINLKDEPLRVTTARGKLGIEKGTYTAFGRELNIVKGQLLFSDGPVDNPGLEFDAERVVGDVHAGVRTRGTLKEPELSLYSDPALSDADIVSYITLGRPAAQAGQGGGSASDALAMATGNLLAENVGDSLGLEEFRVASSGSLEEASLVMGTYLSPQLYVRYSAGFYDTASQFEAIYELNRNWSVRTQTSRIESSADIVFSFER